MNTMRLFGIAATIALACRAAGASWPAPITIDGKFDDWADVPVAYAMDEVPDGLAVKWMKIAHDEQFVFFKFKLTQDILLTGNNPLWLYVDTDNNVSTGLQVHNIGAEIGWGFGQLGGSFYPFFAEIKHPDIKLRSGPSVTSDRFEIAIARDSTIQGFPMFFGDTIRVVMQNSQTGAWFPALTHEISHISAGPSGLSHLHRLRAGCRPLVHHQHTDDVRSQAGQIRPARKRFACVGSPGVRRGCATGC